MAIHIESLQIEEFRGIRQLSIPHFNHINLLTGDNNCGKTSLLEALLLLRNPADFASTLRVARMRDSLTATGSASLFESLLALFPCNGSAAHTIRMQACCNGQHVVYELQGRNQTILLDAEEQNEISPVFTRQKGLLPSECQAFQGELLVHIGSSKQKNDIFFHEYSMLSGRKIAGTRLLNVVYLAPFDHLRGELYSFILKDDSFKNLCAGVAQLFEPGITDFLYMKNEITNRPVEYIRHIELGMMPLSVYGDGIKKVLSIANGIAMSANGVLLIDEVETAIHSRYFEHVFRFIAAASRKFNVQVFVTTHSIEAIDAFLALENDDKVADSEDPISVVTLKRDAASFRSCARVLSGRHVNQNREQFGFEARL